MLFFSGTDNHPRFLGDWPAFSTMFMEWLLYVLACTLSTFVNFLQFCSFSKTCCLLEFFTLRNDFKTSFLLFVHHFGKKKLAKKSFTWNKILDYFNPYSKINMALMISFEKNITIDCCQFFKVAMIKHYSIVFGKEWR